MNNFVIDVLNLMKRADSEVHLDAVGSDMKDFKRKKLAKLEKYLNEAQTADTPDKRIQLLGEFGK